MKKLILVLIAIITYSGGATGVLISTVNNEITLPKTVNVKTNVTDQVAQTVTTQEFVVEGTKKSKFQYAFALTPKSVVTQMKWWYKGKQYVATVSGKPMDSVGGGGTSGGNTNSLPLALKQYLNNSAFTFTFKDSLQTKDSLKVELTYIELLDYSGGRSVIEYPLNMSMFTNANLNFYYNCSIQSSRKILDIKSFQYSTEIEKKELSGKVLFSASDIKPLNNLRIELFFEKKELGVVSFSNKPSKKEDGYMTLMIEPAVQVDTELVLKKVFVFVIDVSGSMAGEKMRNAKEAAKYCIRKLNNSDYFNVVAFNDQSKTFSNNVVQAHEENIQNAISYVDKLQAAGGTDIQGALINGLLQNFTDETSNVIILLTDGQSIVNQNDVTLANKKNTRIFVFGVGSDVDRKVLNDIALNNNGLAEFLSNPEKTDEEIGAFYNKIRNPLLKNVKIAWSRDDINEVYPLQLQDIYLGEQMIVVGKYKESGKADLILTAQGSKGEVKYTYPITLSSDSTENVFTPKVWAWYKISELLRLMESEPSGTSRWKEWRNEIVTLGLQYGIVTKFTSFEDKHEEDNNNGGGDATWLREETITYSPTITVSPNPVDRELRIGFDEDISIDEFQSIPITIRSITGEVLVEFLVNREAVTGKILMFTLSEEMRNVLMNGVYFVDVTMRSRHYVAKFIVCR